MSNLRPGECPESVKSKPVCNQVSSYSSLLLVCFL